MSKSKKIPVLFEVVHEYHWPTMAPVYNAFKNDDSYSVDVKVGPNFKKYFGLIQISQQEKTEQAYRDKGFSVTSSTTGYDIVFCGDTLREPQLYGDALLVNLDHGPCFKTVRYRNLLKQPDTNYVVCAEGQYRVDKLKEYNLETSQTIIDAGFPKIDTFFDGSYSRETILEKHNLDPKKKIVLYAPTYKPTSLLKIAPFISSLKNEFNVIVKLHPYSWQGKYAPHKHHKVYESLVKNHPQICLVDKEDHDIMPYLFAADTLISEASSVINEFLALERCGIIFDLPDTKLTHSDGMPLLAEKTSEWLKESFIHISNPADLSRAVSEACNPSKVRRECLKRDKEYMYSVTDGTSAAKMKVMIEEMLEEKYRSLL